jgi:hypothetical protein
VGRKAKVRIMGRGGVLTSCMSWRDTLRTSSSSPPDISSPSLSGLPSPLSCGPQTKQRLTNKSTIRQDKTDPSKKQISTEKLQERIIRSRPGGGQEGTKIEHRRLTLPHLGSIAAGDSTRESRRGGGGGV